jgi:hypothetical protein
MILISHRGNIDGPIPQKENTTDYIDSALSLGYDVEIDIWYCNKELFLGHDQADYKVSLQYLLDRKNNLWIHCKNLECLEFFNIFKHYNMNYFWHENDKSTLTSKSYIWALPGMQPVKNSIAVLPELHNEGVTSCLGICSDFISKYNV